MKELSSILDRNQLSKRLNKLKEKKGGERICMILKIYKKSQKNVINNPTHHDSA